MEINDALVDRLANLAKLDFNANERLKIKQDLAEISVFFKQINGLDTEGVEPLIYINEEVNVFRADEVKQLINKAEGLKNAPRHDEDYIKVPKVIQK